jgi:hypothetical protein
MMLRFVCMVVLEWIPVLFHNIAAQPMIVSLVVMTIWIDSAGPLIVMTTTTLTTIDDVLSLLYPILVVVLLLLWLLLVLLQQRLPSSSF